MKILIAYASRYGSTEEAAKAIGGILTQAGAEVDLLPVGKVNDISPYRFVILGTSIRIGKPLKDAISLVNKYRAELSRTPVALFSLGLQMKEDTAENREKTRGFLAPLLRIIGEPVSLGLFAGRIDHKRFGFFLRFFARHEKTGILNEGDWRDWEEIRKWAESLIPLLSSEK